MRNFSKVMIFGLVLVLAMGMLAGCGASSEEAAAPSNNETSEASKDAGLEGNVVLVGSTSVTPVAQKLAEAFMAKEPGVKVDVQGVGSSAGVKAAHDGSADIGMASRNLKEAEKEWGLTEHVIAFDGIAVVVNPENAVNELTKDQITQIFKGEITNWSEVGGADKEILVVSREAGSGTRGAYEGIMNLQEKNDAGKKVSVVREDALFADGNGAVKANVASKADAIGYVSLSYLDDSLQTVAVDGVDPTIDNILADKYPVSRPFLMLTKGEITPAAQAYLDFAFSAEGQEIVSEKNIPVK